VRELRNVLERAAIVGGSGPLEAGLLRALLEPALAASEVVVAAPGGGDLQLRHNLDALEKQLVQRALDKCEGRKKDAAALLGIDPRNLGYYLRKHGLSDLPPRA
jgi:transcriptional regulator with GAF, ATPase, and Fis domain